MPPVGKLFSQKLQILISNSELGIRLALLLGRVVPPNIGYPLVRGLADFISGRQSWGMVRGVRLNQWVVGGRQFSSSELDRVVQNTLRNQARALYDLYRYLAWPNKMKDRLFIPQVLKELIEYSQCPTPGQGKVIVGVHLSNFDFALHTLVRYGSRALAVTVPTLGGGYQEQFELRARSGLEIMPASIHSFRLGIERLKAGKLVLTGIDRPIQDPKHYPVFFGYPAPLPVHHVYMALKADVPLLLMSVIMDPDGIYRIMVSEPIVMISNPDRNQELVQNAEAVLSIAEQFIKQAPEQWAMYFPVWPTLSETVP